MEWKISKVVGISPGCRAETREGLNVGVDRNVSICMPNQSHLHTHPPNTDTHTAFKLLQMTQNMFWGAFFVCLFYGYTWKRKQK